MASAIKNLGKNLNLNPLVKNLDGGDIAGGIKKSVKDAKVDVPIKPKDNGLDPPNTKPKDTGVEPPKAKTTAENAKDLAKNVAVGGGLAGLAVFLPGLITQAGNTATTLGGTKIITDGIKEMFNSLLDSPEGLTAVVAIAGVVAYMSIRR
jgi:hypothetical protein